MQHLRLLPRHLFFSICLGKEYAEVIKFLGILKKYVSEDEIYLFSRKKRKVYAKEARKPSLRIIALTVGSVTYSSYHSRSLFK